MSVALSIVSTSRAIARMALRPARLSAPACAGRPRVVMPVAREGVAARDHLALARGLGHQHAAVPPRLVLDQRARARAAQLLVGDHQEGDGQRRVAASRRAGASAHAGRGRCRPSCRARPDRTAGRPRCAASGRRRSCRRDEPCRDGPAPGSPGPRCGRQRRRASPVRPTARPSARSPHPTARKSASATSNMRATASGVTDGLSTAAQRMMSSTISRLEKLLESIASS